ncbi:spike base protein, RCAP_Rcc01079 family [Cupriavidus sp.]|uniref:spike base protein, RCAP_Rcc01079 family n=1 Tax=Cupriavidus sp. TaxID=1873897 RepID=UPI003D0F1FAA
MTFKDASSPAIKAAVVTPSDTAVLDPPTKSLYIGTTGDLTVVLADDTTTVTFTQVPAGTVLPVMVKKVMATGTAATNIVALY